MWVYVLIVLILLAIIGMGALLYMRNIRKDEISSQQSRLEDVRALPFQDILVKVKDYNLHGEALTLYKKWQSDWQNALNSSLTEAEKELGSASEDIDRFRFNDGREKAGSVKETLDGVEQQYQALTSEIGQLLDSNETGERNFNESEKLYRE